MEGWRQRLRSPAELSELGSNVRLHPGHLGRVGLLGRLLPPPSDAPIALYALGEGVIEHGRHGRGLTGFDKLFGVGGEIRIHGDGQARFPVAHIRIIRRWCASPKRRAKAVAGPQPMR